MDPALLELLIMLLSQQGQGGLPSQPNFAGMDEDLLDIEGDMLLNAGRRADNQSDFADAFSDPVYALLTDTFDYMPPAAAQPLTPQTDLYMAGPDVKAKAIAEAITTQGMTPQMAVQALTRDGVLEQGEDYSGVADTVWEEYSAAKTAVPQTSAADAAAQQMGLPSIYETYSAEKGNLPQTAYMQAMRKRIAEGAKPAGVAQRAINSNAISNVDAELQEYNRLTGYEGGAPVEFGGDLPGLTQSLFEQIAKRNAAQSAPVQRPTYEQTSAIANHDYNTQQADIYQRMLGPMLTSYGRTPFTDMRDQRVAAMRQMLGM